MKMLRIVWIVLVLAVFVICLYFLQNGFRLTPDIGIKGINEIRVEEKLHSRIYLHPGQEITGMLLGGFRGIAADILWLQIDEYWHHGQWYKCLPLYKTIGFLQPNFLNVWILGGWHAAYNICYQAGVSPRRTVQERMRDQHFWIAQGLDFLKLGIENNPDVYNIYFETGWTYFNKVKDFKEAAGYFAEAAQFDCPSFVSRMYAHALYDSGDKEASFHVWKNLLAELDDKEKKEPLNNKDLTHKKVVKKFYNRRKKELGKGQ